MNKLNVTATAFLVIAIVMGVVNLKIYSSLQAVSSQLSGSVVPLPTDGAQNLATVPSITKHASGAFSSFSGHSLQMDTSGGRITFTLSNSMSFYIKGVAENTYNQVQAIGDLSLNPGDNVTIAFNTNTAGEKIAVEIVKVVNTK